MRTGRDIRSRALACDISKITATACAILGLVLLALAAPVSAHRPHAHIEGSRAVAPKSAPREVKQMIRAGNKIRDKKYKWGGGHSKWHDKGYDCSGSVSFVLHAAGLLDYPLASGDLKKWGRPHKGRWVTIYANNEHVFMVIAGLRWDTSYITDGDKDGPGWSEMKRSHKGFKTRHPTGL